MNRISETLRELSNEAWCNALFDIVGPLRRAMEIAATELHEDTEAAASYLTHHAVWYETRASYCRQAAALLEGRLRTNSGVRRVG